MAMKKLNIFLMIVTFVPKYAFSMGYVSIPTIINVVVKADNTIYVTPFFNKIPHSGKAMNPGIKVTEPKNEARVMPTNLFLSPRYFKMISSGIRKRINETRISMLKKAGKILINFLTAILTALDVLSGLLKTEIKRANRVSIYK
jgi:hypothetical protein